MRSRTDLVLKTAKEVAVKFIETGRLSLAGFPEAFAKIYESVDAVVPDPLPESVKPEKDGKSGKKGK